MLALEMNTPGFQFSLPAHVLPYCHMLFQAKDVLVSEDWRLVFITPSLSGSMVTPKGKRGLKHLYYPILKLKISIVF